MYVFRCNKSQLPLAKSYLKNVFKSKFLPSRQSYWDNTENGVHTYNSFQRSLAYSPRSHKLIIELKTYIHQLTNQPKVSYNLYNLTTCIAAFITDHGIFMTHLKQRKITSPAICWCGYRGTPAHYYLQRYEIKEWYLIRSQVHLAEFFDQVTLA